VVSEWRRSGESVQQFAAQHALDPQRVYLWRRRSSAQRKAGKTPRPEVIEVDLGRMELPGERRMDIELVSGRRLSASERIDLEVLERVVAVLER
jgi:hypothetical protein